MLQWRNWTATKAKLFEFSLFNGNHEIVDKACKKSKQVTCFYLKILEKHVVFISPTKVLNCNFFFFNL